MKMNKTILVVDDTETNIEILLDLLSPHYDIMAALDGVTALEIAQEENIDLILLDIMMPDMDGYQVCKKLKENRATKDIPIIFITAKMDEDSIEKAYDIGGTDYVTKPFKPKELLARVKTQLTMQNLIEKLKLLSSTDPMTKLYNRRYFNKISEHTFETAKRDKKDISIIMLDIDKFKNINDTYGHQVGDNAIIKLAEILLDNQRKSDITCRYGGEEFVLLLPNTSNTGATILANKIRACVEENIIKLNTKDELRFTVSIGVSQVDINNEINIESSLKRADDALYNAKCSGRNRVCIK